MASKVVRSMLPIQDDEKRLIREQGHIDLSECLAENLQFYNLKLSFKSPDAHL
jgi:hypothetical protein